MTFALSLVCILLSAHLTAGADDSNIDQLIDEVYGPASSTTEYSNIPVPADNHEGGGGGGHSETHQNQGNCECVPYYQCNDKNGTVNTDGVDLIDIR